MVRVRLLGSSMAFAIVAACGGGGEGTPPPPPVIVNPTPSPSPTPTPPPNPPSPAPGTGAGSIEFLHVFGIDEEDGLYPNGPLLRASDGNFYGTTKQGGGRCANATSPDGGCGTVFRATPAGTVSIVYRFKGGAGDGMNPLSALIQGNDGALYGTTGFGGANGRGTAFRVTLGGEYRVLHHFDGARGTGDRPVGRLVQAQDGNLYGTTIGGGPNNCSGGDCGTVFRLSSAGEHRVIYNFGSKPGDGAVPYGSLIEGDDGALYGTTVVGGDAACSDPQLFPRIDGCGTIFRITTSGELTTLHAFGPTLDDGMLPSGGLARGPDGAFYGATAGGGTGQCIGDFAGCGVIFRITPAGAFHIVYRFSLKSTQLPGETLPGSDGFAPAGHLWLGRDGRFYGVTARGGVTTATDTGTLFSLTLSGSKTILYRFGPGSQGPAVPVGGLVEGADGVFWGVTNYNGGLGAVGARIGAGTLFRVTAPKGS